MTDVPTASSHPQPTPPFPIETKPASEIPVRSYSQILLWPVLLQETSRTAGDSSRHQPQLEKWIEGFCKAGWSERDTLPLSNPPDEPPASDVQRWGKRASGDAGKDLPGNEPTFEEIVYFHPFVRDFLYGDGDTNPKSVGVKRSLRRLVREDVKELDVTLGEFDGGRTFVFDVVRTELYLCKPLVAIFVMEIWWSEQKSQAHVPHGQLPLSLAQVQTLQGRVRQVFPPYFMGDAPGNCPARVALFGPGPDGKRKLLVQSDFDQGRLPFARFVHRGAEPPVAKHWQWLMEPLTPFDQCLMRQDAYRQIIDERIPGITFVTVDNPREIREGDFDRLTFCETPGDAPYPYSAEFLADNRSNCHYNRFWRSTADQDGSDFTLNTRYLCSGYQFVAVGSAEKWFFNTLIRDHLRRHYFRMGLIVHYHRAALLKFADEMAEAIELLQGEEPSREWGHKAFRQRVAHLQMTFLKFRARTWFSEVSNQLQGQELFEWWSRLLETRRLFAHVDQLNQQIYSGMAEYEGRQLSKRSYRLSWAALIVAGVSLVVSLILGVVSAFG